LDPGQARDDAILKQFLDGNVPDFLRTPVKVTSEYGSHMAILSVFPDYLAIGKYFLSER
jgi:hypothetical protein